MSDLAEQPKKRNNEKRKQTRARIEAAALSLFMTRGFINVTVQDISNAAKVAPATFWRIFGSKEEVLFPDIPALSEKFVDTLLQRPEGESLSASMTEAIKTIFMGDPTELSLLRLRVMVAGEVETVANQIAIYESKMREVFAQGIARRLGITNHLTPMPFLVAGLFLSYGALLMRRLPEMPLWTEKEFLLIVREMNTYLAGTVDFLVAEAPISEADR